MREMKDSGIEWIGEIPKEWGICKIKNVCSLIGSGTTPASDNFEYYENGTINWIQSGDIYGKLEINGVSTLITQKAVNLNRTLKIYAAPFIVVAMYGGSVGNTAISNIDACTNQACCSIKSNSMTDIRFLFYWIDFCKNDFLLKAEGGGQTNISQDKIKNQYFITPPLEEQNRIANYLDNKCAQIDSLYSDIQEQIQTLEEYKKSIITEAVTKGLNPDVEMKDSGIEWIGDIPKEWGIVRVKDAFTRKKAKAKQEEPVVLSLARSGIKIRDISNNEGQLAESYNDYNPVTIDDLLINPMDLISGDNCNISKVEGVISPAYVNLRYKNGINPNFYNYYFKYQYWCKAFFAHGKGVSYENRWTLNIDTLGRFPLVLPPSEEQNCIANYLDNKCTQIENIIDTKQQQLQILEEYKKSLIYEYVTGKKEVSYE